MSVGPIATAMVTPFYANGGLNLPESARLARHLVDAGNDALVIAGSTGEGQALSDVERVELVDAVKVAVGNRARIVANAGSNDTRASVAAAVAAEKAGADAILAVVPYYNKPSQSGMLAHFGAIAQATALPVVVYNIPSRTGANILPETLLELASRFPTIAGVKESSGDLRQIATIVRDRAAGFEVLCGDDHLFLAALAVGADGVVGVASHLCTPHYRAIYDAFTSGEVTEAARINASLLALFAELFAAPNPIAVKWAMREAGFAAGECRLPLDTLPEANVERLRPLIAPFLAS